MQAPTENRGFDLEERRKAIAALHRAVPLTRMRDYGMSSTDAAALGVLSGDHLGWDETAAELAERRLKSADKLLALSQACRAAQEIEWAAAALMVGQLAFNRDCSRKVELFTRSQALYARAAEISHATHRRIVLHGDDERKLYGWTFPQESSPGTVIIIGGLSGWGSAYFGMARAFNRRGLSVMICDLPGQGETRMSSKLFLSRDTLSAVNAFIAEALVYAPSVGVMGNSFGGVIAAHVAASDSRISACCINGAAPTQSVPEFRTVSEQMEAAFGVKDAQLQAKVEEFSFNPAKTPIKAPLLIIEGGADPLVPLGAQAGYLADDYRDSATVMTWPDGEHTIYNHATDRDALVSAWFLDQLNRSCTR